LRAAKVVSKAKSMPESDKVRSLCIIKRPARMATDSGLNWDIPAAIASALTYSKHSKKLGNNFRETVVLPEPLGPPIM